MLFYGEKPIEVVYICRHVGVNFYHNCAFRRFFSRLLGSLTGLGGGVIIIPLLTLGLGVDIHYAIGASIISVIATSTGSAAAYVKKD